MFYRIILFFVLIVFLGCNPKKNQNTNDLLRMQLKGKIASVTIREYSIVMENNRIVEEEFNELGFFGKTVFDSIGNKKEQITFYEDGEPNRTTYFQYDNNHNLLSYQCKNEYDEEEFNCTLKTKDDTKNVLIVKTYQTGIQEQTLMLLDDYQNVIERTFIDGNGEPTGQIKYQYDDNGNMIQASNYGANGNLKTYETLFYNEENLLTQTEERMADGVLTHKYTYTYVFDKNGNWIEQIRYSSLTSNSTSKSGIKITRTIEYR